MSPGLNVQGGFAFDPIGFYSGLMKSPAGLYRSGAAIPRGFLSGREFFDRYLEAFD